MTDREMLFFTYGVLKSLSSKSNSGSTNLDPVVDLVEAHIYPPIDEIEMTGRPEPLPVPADGQWARSNE